jgi:hypothetical protein
MQVATRAQPYEFESKTSSVPRNGVFRFASCALLYVKIDAIGW